MSDLQNMFDECHTVKFQKITDEARAKISAAHRNQNRVKYKFQDKTTNQWREIINGTPGEILKHIKNNTMETYGPYRKYIGLPPLPRGQWNLKHFMTPKGIMTYEQAKKAFGFNYNGSISRRVRSEDFPDWYEVTAAE